MCIQICDDLSICISKRMLFDEFHDSKPWAFQEGSSRASAHPISGERGCRPSDSTVIYETAFAGLTVFNAQWAQYCGFKTSCQATINLRRFPAC